MKQRGRSLTGAGAGGRASRKGLAIDCGLPQLNPRPIGAPFFARNHGFRTTRQGGHLIDKLGATIRRRPSRLELLVVVAIVAACQVPSPRLATGEPPVVILPLITVDGMPFISVQTDNAEARLWLLDSGFEITVVNARFADSLHVPIHARQKSAAPGGHTEVGRVPGIPLHLGEVTFLPDSLDVVDLQHVEPLLGLSFAGILGHDFLLEYVVRIDYDGQRVELFAPDSFVYTGPGKSLPLWIEADEPFVLGVLHSNGRATPAKLKLDTGSLDALGLNGSFVQQTELVRGSQHQLPAMGATLGGAVEAYVVRLDSIVLGDAVIARPIAGYSVETDRRGDAGTIGVALLSRFNLVFDYSRSRLIVEATATSRRPMAYDASGLLLAGSGPDYREIKVVWVDPDSPAAAAGIRPADFLVSIDSTGVQELGLTRIRARLTQPGPVTLRVASHGAFRDVTLRLKDRL